MKEQIIAVQRMQEYIEEHIQDNITLAALSNISLFSPWYSYRLFKQYTGLSVAEYIRRLRLSKSAMLLKNEKKKVTDVAFELGYDSVDGYQRAFRKEFGYNPSEYAKDPSPISLFIPYGVKFKELRKEYCKMEELQNVFVQVIKKPERKVIIKRGKKAADYFAYCDEVGCDVWGIISSMDSIGGEPVCLWLPKKYRSPDSSEYVQGVETMIDESVKIPDGFDVITLPECEYLMFQGEPFVEEKYSEAIQSVQYSMSKYDPSLIGYEWDDENPKIQLEPRGERGYIELRAVKPLNILL